MVEVGKHKYTTTTGEFTGVTGLLRLNDLLLPPDFRPSNTLLVGAITHNSLVDLLQLFSKLGWTETRVVVVDKSIEPVMSIDGLVRRNAIHWDKSIQVTHLDVVNYNPERPFDLVVADIVNTYNIPPYHFPYLSRKSPYTDYKNILWWVKRNLTEGGHLLERTLTFPLRRSRKNVGHRDEVELETRVKLVRDILPEKQGIDPDYLDEELGQVFPPAYPPTFCSGFTGKTPAFTSVAPCWGDKPPAILDRIHTRVFGQNNLKRVEVFDPQSECRFISYGCRKTN